MEESSPNPDEALRTIDQYTLIEKLGEGYLGPVFRGFDQDLGRPVAVRILCDGIKWEGNVEELFFQVCNRAAGLQHPNIVSIFDVGKGEQAPYIVMESSGNGNLESIIAKKIPMTVEAKLSIMIQAAEGLSHAHKNGILHRDLGPRKIHVTTDGSAKIRDFAVTHILRKHLPRPVVRWGDPIYLSPEQIQQKDGDERSDIFSAGVIFYELLTYFHPFHDPNGNKALDNVLLDIPIPTFEKFPDVPPAFWPILKTCMAIDPKDRYQSMDELLAACRDLQISLAEDTQLMLAELFSSLNPLKKAAAQPNARRSTIELYREIQELSLGEKAPDYVRLDQLMTDLIDQTPIIQTAADEPEAIDPLPSAEDRESPIPDPIETVPSEAPIEEASVQTESPESKPAANNSSQIADPAGELAASSVENPIESIENVMEEEDSGLPETETEAVEDLDPDRQQSSEAFSVEPDEEPEKELPSAVAMEEDQEEQPGSIEQDSPNGVELYRRRAEEISRSRIPWIAFIAAVIVLSILGIAAAGYIVFGTDSPASANTALPRTESESFLEAYANADMQSASSEMNPFSAAVDKALQEIGSKELDKSNNPKPSVIAPPQKQQTKSSRERREQERIEQENAARKQREAEWSQAISELFVQGNYREAGNVLNTWLAENPGNIQALEFKAKLEEIEHGLSIFDSAMAEKRYKAALAALGIAERNNPADPSLAKLRRQVEAKIATARAVLTVHRLGPEATLLLDGQAAGTKGEILNEAIPIGPHTVSIENNGGLVASRSQEYVEGQRVTLIYDLAKLMLRPMVEADRELLAQRKMMEEVHRFELDHEHGLLRGSCRGILHLDYYDVVYEPFSGPHGFRIPFKLLRISKVDGKSIELSFISDNKRFQKFKFQNDGEAKRFMRIWGDLKAIPQ